LFSGDSVISSERSKLLAPASASGYPHRITRAAHDTAFSIASALTEKMNGKLPPADLRPFHEMVYQVRKAAIEQHDAKRDRGRDRVEGYGREAAAAHRGGD
jgi:hypothetical protein